MTPAAKKTAASRSKDEPTDEPGGLNPSRDSGPGTGQDAPDEAVARPPATSVSQEPGAAPLVPPDAKTQTEPEHGYKESSTDHLYAEAGGRTIAGEEHVRIEDGDGNALAPDDLFDYPERKTYAEAKTRVFEVFRYPKTGRDVKRLLFAEGRRVPLQQAERVRAQAEAAAED
jgi:hypothetical protein